MMIKHLVKIGFFIERKKLLRLLQDFSIRQLQVIDERIETYNHVKLFNIVRKKVKTCCIDINAAGTGE